MLNHFHFTYGNPVADWREWGFITYLERFTGYIGGIKFAWFPFVGSFWFLRDLMMLIIFSPVLFLLIRRFPFLIILASSLCYLFSMTLPFVQSVSFFYFSFGIFFASQKIYFFALTDKINWFDIIIPFTTAFTIYTLQPDYNTDGGIHHSIFFFLFIFSGILGLLKFSNIIINNECAFSLAKKLAPYTFFTYAIHSPILIEIIKKLTYRITSVQTYEGAFRSLAQFVLACILDIGISLGTGILLSKICPPIFVVLSGGRRKQ